MIQGDPGGIGETLGGIDKGSFMGVGFCAGGFKKEGGV